MELISSGALGSDCSLCSSRRLSGSFRMKRERRGRRETEKLCTQEVESSNAQEFMERRRLRHFLKILEYLNFCLVEMVSDSSFSQFLVFSQNSLKKIYYPKTFLTVLKNSYPSQNFVTFDNIVVFHFRRLIPSSSESFSAAGFCFRSRPFNPIFCLTTQSALEFLIMSLCTRVVICALNTNLCSSSFHSKTPISNGFLVILSDKW